MFSTLLSLLTNGFFLSYIKSKSFEIPLTPKEEAKYLERFFNGDQEARNVLIERNLRLVAHIAKKYENNKTYFRYTKINFYKIKNFSTFLSLIETGDIKISFNVGVYKKGNKYGQTYDHGTNFEIKKENITKLYDHI